jgi:hypothetical protein
MTADRHPGLMVLGKDGLRQGELVTVPDGVVKYARTTYLFI